MLNVNVLDVTFLNADHKILRVQDVVNLMTQKIVLRTLLSNVQTAVLSIQLILRDAQSGKLVKFNHNLTFPAARKLVAQRQSTNSYASEYRMRKRILKQQTDLSSLPVPSSSCSTRPSCITIKQGSFAHSISKYLHIFSQSCNITSSSSYISY